MVCRDPSNIRNAPFYDSFDRILVDMYDVDVPDRAALLRWSSLQVNGQQALIIRRRG